MSVGIREVGSIVKIMNNSYAYIPTFAYPFKRRKIITYKTDFNAPKVRPKENRIYVPSKRKDESIVRYLKEDCVYAKITEADWLRDKTVHNPIMSPFVKTT